MRFRSKILSCFLAIALVMACVPVNVETSENGFIRLSVNEADANPVAVAGALAFLESAASAAGLTSAQFVATCAGIATISTGMAWGRQEGIKMGDSLSDNLDNLIDAADYPAWESLTSEQQNSWGSQENYNAAKFNSLMGAFGLENERDEFYSSGGANFEWQDNAQDRLNQLGRIGSNWVNNASNTVQDLISTLTPNSQSVFETYYGVSDSRLINGSDYSNWPANAPNNIYVTNGNYFYYEVRVEGYGARTTYYQKATGSDVIWITIYSGTTMSVWCCSKQSFMFGQNSKTLYDSNNPGQVVLVPVSLNETSSEKTINGNTFYVIGTSTSGISSYRNSNMNINVFSSVINANDMYKMMEQILFGPDLNLGALPVDVVGFPEDIEEEPDTDIYFPSLGISPSITWDEYQTEQDSGSSGGGESVDLTEIINILRHFQWYASGALKVYDAQLDATSKEIVSNLNKFTFYANGVLKVHDEGVYDLLTDIQSTLLGIKASVDRFFLSQTTSDVIGDLDFSELGQKSTTLLETISSLAPFGALLLLSDLIAILSQTGKISKPELVFPFRFMPGSDYSVTIDLSWLDDAKPIINAMCIITLLVGLYGVTARLIELEAAA